MHDSVSSSETPSEIFHHKFFQFTQFQTKRPDRDEISLRQMHFWCQIANIYDDKFKEETLTEIFNKFKKRTLVFEDFLLLVREISLLTRQRYDLLQKKLAECDSPIYAILRPESERSSRSRSTMRSYDDLGTEEEERKMRRERLVNNILKKENLTNKLKTMELQEKLARLANGKERPPSRKKLSASVLDDQLRAHEAKEEAEKQKNRKPKKSVDITSEIDDDNNSENGRYDVELGKSQIERDENLVLEEERIKSPTHKSREGKSKTAEEESEDVDIVRNKKKSHKVEKSKGDKSEDLVSSTDEKSAETEDDGKSKIRRSRLEDVRLEAEERRKSRERRIKAIEQKRASHDEEIERLERELAPDDAKRLSRPSYSNERDAEKERERREEAKMRRDRYDLKQMNIERRKRDSIDQKRERNQTPTSEPRIRKLMDQKKGTVVGLRDKSNEEMNDLNRDEIF